MVTYICQVLEAIHNVSQQRLMRVEPARRRLSYGLFDRVQSDLAVCQKSEGAVSFQLTFHDLLEPCLNANKLCSHKLCWWYPCLLARCEQYVGIEP